MQHICQWPLEDGECGKLAHHFIELEELNEAVWLCAHHWDFIADLLRGAVGELDGPQAATIAKIIRRNNLS